VLAGEHLWFEADVIDPSEGTGPWIAERSTEARPNVARRFL